MRCLLVLLAIACAPSGSSPDKQETPDKPETPLVLVPTVSLPRAEPVLCSAERAIPEWGARLEGDLLRVRVRSRAATRLAIELFREPRFAEAVASFPLEKEGEVFRADLAREQIPIDGTIYYGLRAWGPNWPFDPAWTPGSTAGFVSHVDAEGNRFNPNKLLIDPYALEISHDPLNPEHLDYSVFHAREGDHVKDSAPYAPKGIVLPPDHLPCWTRPNRPLSRSIIYEVHLRGLTMQDPSVPEEWRGTYRGAAEKAEYLASLGVTTIELLPLHETQNDHNDLAGGPAPNYWGYANWSFFAPDRRYAFDRSPGGPTREVREMVRAFHRAGIEVFVDVVYNHTAEGGTLSWRGIDNRAYYELSEDRQGYASHNGVGPNLNATDPIARDMVIDSLRYYRDELGLDGFRFDLAPLLGNRCERSCFSFDPNAPQGILQRAVDLGGLDLIAEPWGVVAGTYQLGHFPRGWAEWNDLFRDTIRRDQNRLGVEAVTPAQLAERLLGSNDVFGDRGPSASINYVVSHDGYNLRDLYSYAGDGLSWDYGGDPTRQRQAARTALALLMISAGVPMITGGDEMYRTQLGNTNPYNIDSPVTWLDWSEADRHPEFLAFARFVMGLRQRHPSLGSSGAELLTDLGERASAAYLADPSRHFLGILRDDTYVAYNGWSGGLTVHLPDPGEGRVWKRAVDTGAGFEAESNHQPLEEAEPIEARIYDLTARTVAIFIR